MVFGQNETKNLLENEKTTPQFVGNNSEDSPQINNYLLENIVCPRETAECRKEGTEIVRFTVTPSGELTNFTVVNSVCPKMDDEFIRVLKTTNGMWKPVYNNGVPTEMQHEVAVMVGDYNENIIVSHFFINAKKYFEIGSINLLEKQKPAKALKFFNKSGLYLPNDKSLLTLRGLCHYELGDKENAEKDWNRIKTLGGEVPVGLAPALTIENDISEMKGYSEMISLLDSNKKE
jgi:tetratricopeptide (TPR) repeat protein